MPGKPTDQQDEYFARLEFERRRTVGRSSTSPKRSQKASVRQTSPEQAAAGQQAAGSKSQSRKATSAAANETRNARQFTKTRASAIQAHSRARGQQRQARRDSR